MLERYLEDLEERIDERVEADLARQWRDFVDGRFEGDVFSPRRLRPSPPKVEWPKVTTNEAFGDFDKMVLQQFGAASRRLAEATGALMCVRANYGTSILPSLFGPKLFMMDDDLDTLPTSWPLEGGASAIEKILDRGAPDVTAALGGKTLEMGGRFAAIREKYPKISRHVHVYHPDLQGPMDVCEVLWGSGIFLDLVDRHDLVKSMLALVTETYIRLMRRWDGIVGSNGGYAVHWDMLFKGHIFLRDDSAMNLSPHMFEEFVKPYDQRLLDEFGGGGIHFCGRGEHFIESMSGMRGLTAVAMSQPELNDMEKVFACTVDKGFRLLDLARSAVDEAKKAGRDLKHSVHCW